MPPTLASNDATISALARKLAPAVADLVIAELRQVLPSPITDRPPFSITEAATFTGLSRATIERRIADGTLKATKIGRAVRISAADVDRLLSGAYR
jgi:excisionase family DNA binding protein